MDTDTKNVIFKIFIIIIVLIASYFAYLEIKRFMVARKVEQKIEKVEKKIGNVVGFLQDNAGENYERPF